MTTDKRIIDAIFARNPSAYAVFYSQCRNLFEAWFRKRYPESAPIIEDLYQDSIVEMWAQITDGRLNRNKVQQDLSPFLIGIGKNKYFEEIRRSKKDSKYKQNLPQRKTYTRKEDKDKEESEDVKYPLQSKRQQKDLDTKINEILHSLTRPKDQIRDLTLEERIERQQHVRGEIMKMPEPCRQLILDTWDNDLSDEDIFNEFKDRFPTIGAMKMQKHRCHKKLKERLQPWYDEQIN